jgi:multidrug efflux pump subunit AcrB
VALVVFKQAGANVIETVERITALLPQLREGIPPAITLDVMADRTRTIRASVHEVQFTLLLTMGLVVGIVFLFLRNIRATFIASLVVPTSIVATFAAMYVLDYSLDNLSLMGLTIAVGFVIDDAIVMLENIYVHLEKGSTPVQAALDGAKEMGFTILSITLSLVAVFIPALLMGGIVGRLFREFAVVVSIAIMISAFVSLTLIPMACARLLKPVDHAAKPGVFDRALERFFVGLEHGYAAVLRAVLRHQVLTLLAGCSSRCPRASSPSRTPGSSRRPSRPRPTSRSRRCRASSCASPRSSPRTRPSSGSRPATASAASTRPRTSGGSSSAFAPTTSGRTARPR